MVMFNYKIENVIINKISNISLDMEDSEILKEYIEWFQKEPFDVHNYTTCMSCRVYFHMVDKFLYYNVKTSEWLSVILKHKNGRFIYTDFQSSEMMNITDTGQFEIVKVNDSRSEFLHSEEVLDEIKDGFKPIPDGYIPKIGDLTKGVR